MTTRMMESRVEALEKTLATRIQLLEGFEGRLNERLSQMYVDLEANLL